MEMNGRLKKENDRLMAESLLRNEVVMAEKENSARMSQKERTPERVDYRKRIEELEDKVILRDKKINMLNN